jgi:hypothetical protein
VKEMIKEIATIMVLLALCIPALAVNMPDLLGNWTGTVHGVGYLKNTDYQTTGKPDYWDDNYTIVINEQNGTRFSGKMILDANPLNSEVVVGAIGSDNKTINMVDDSGYYWGSLKSPVEMELFGQEVNIDYIDMGTGIFTKE